MGKKINLNRILHLLVAFLMVESVLGGPIGIVKGFRYTFYILLFFSIAIHIYLHKVDINSKPNKLFFFAPLYFFLINLFWIFVIPTFTDNNLNLAIEDGKSLLFLPLISIFFLLENKKNLLRIAIKGVLFSSIFLSACIILLWIFYSFHPIEDVSIKNFFDSFYNTENGRGIFVGLDAESDRGKFIRIFWINSIWIPVTAFISPLIIKNRRALIGSTFVLAFASYLTYSRGIYFGILCAMIYLAFIGKKPPFLKSIFLGFFLSAVFFSTFDYLVNKQYSFASRFVAHSESYPNNDLGVFLSNKEKSSESNRIKEKSSESNRIRIKESKYLAFEFLKKPFFGWGFGHSVKDMIVDEKHPYSYEMQGLSLLMKLGIVGILIYIFFIFKFLKYIFTEKMLMFSKNIITSSLVVFIISCQFNPLFFSSVGMSILLFFFILTRFSSI
jgi:hypothetical protein